MQSQITTSYCARFASLNAPGSSVASTSKRSRAAIWAIATVPCGMHSVWRNAAVREKISARNFA